MLLDNVIFSRYLMQVSIFSGSVRFLCRCQGIKDGGMPGMESKMRSTRHVYTTLAERIIAI